MKDGSDVRTTLLSFLKESGSASIHQMAAKLNITYEAARQHIINFEKEGWVVKRSATGSSRSVGRPEQRYYLTVAGDHQFTKSYDALTVEVLDTLADEYGLDAVKALLHSMVSKRVRAWQPALQGKTLREKLEMLRDIYHDGDPYMTIEEEDGVLRLIERNCPFLNVAMSRPVICNITVSTLTQLLGVKVRREQKFQSGNGCCSFRILADEPIDVNDPMLTIEEE